MGLEMFLDATRNVAPCDSRTEPMRRAIEAAIGFVPPKVTPGHDASLLQVCGVTVRVGYWATCKGLHRWFVDHVQGGHDDYRPASVSSAHLHELQRLCERVIEDPAYAVGHFNAGSGTNIAVDELRYTLEILAHAIDLEQQGWWIHYRASC